MRLLLACIAAFFGMTTMTSERVVARRAEAELACPASELEVTCNRGGAVFHMAVQIRCEARGCGQIATYRCETPLRELGPFEVRYATVCE